MSQQNILLIQQDPLDVKAVSEALNNSADDSFKIEWIRACNEGLERLAREGVQRGNRIAAILLD